MRILIAAVGRARERHWRDAAEEYAKRLRPYAKLSVVEVPDAASGRGGGRASEAEGEALLRAVPESAHVVALDLAGRHLSSEELAEWLQQAMVSGRSELAFVVGGADGLSTEVLRRADDRMALSRMTLPHEMARVVLLEQLYRAFRISRGEPYHR